MHTHTLILTHTVICMYVHTCTHTYDGAEYGDRDIGLWGVIKVSPLVMVLKFPKDTELITQFLEIVYRYYILCTCTCTYGSCVGLVGQVRVLEILEHIICLCLQLNWGLHACILYVPNVVLQPLSCIGNYIPHHLPIFSVLSAVGTLVCVCSDSA